MFFYNVRYIEGKSWAMMQFNARNQTSEQRKISAIAFAKELIIKGMENVQVTQVMPGTSLESPIEF